jgi:hypothetical protein
MAITQTDLITEIQQSKPNIEAQALSRFRSSDAYQSHVTEKMRELHSFYQPNQGDQWPADRAKRPGKIHVTFNIVKPAVDVDARLQSIPPRVTIPTATLPPTERKRAEAAEAIIGMWLEASGWENWLNTLCQTRSLYGKGVLKPYWNSVTKQPDVHVVENIGNLRLGWGSNDYTLVDWALYEYSLSPMEVMARWPQVQVAEDWKRGAPNINILGYSDHDDPLDQKRDDYWQPRYRELSAYEKKQVKVWDYWYKGKDGVVMNSVLLNGRIVEGPTPHKYLADIPYIVIENDHEPGSPEGVSTVEPILNLQYEFNRLMSHGLQHIADDVDPAWYLKGPSAQTVPPGLIPRAGEVIGAGENDILQIPKGVNTFPIESMAGELWNVFHRLTGLPEILFGQTPGSDTSGRAIAVQVEAAANRLDPRRRRLYTGMRELLIFWTIMAERKNPRIKVEIDEETGEERSVGIKKLIGGFRQFKIIAPEITPRDNAEVTQNEINKVNAMLSSRRTSMNATGIEAPEAELQVIAQEQMNADLNPAAVQAKVAIYPMLMQMQQQMGDMAQALQPQQMGPGMGPVAAAESAANEAQMVAQGAQPTALGPDQNVPGGPGMPTTQPGMPGAPGSPQQQSGSLTSMVRQGEPMSQIRTDVPL